MSKRDYSHWADTQTKMMSNSGREWDWMYNLIKNEKEMDENEEPIYRYGIEDLMLTKTEHTKERSKYVTITDSNGDVLGEVEIYIIEPYE